MDLEKILEKYKELEKKLYELSSEKKFEELKEVAKEYEYLKELVLKIEDYKKLKEYIEELEKLKELEKDPKMKSEITEEIENSAKSLEKIENELKELIKPKDPNDELNAIIEIRAGAGGDEAGIFAGDLFRMYSKYAEKKGWKIHVIDSHPNDYGGFKEIVFIVEGRGAYGRLKYEGGVHRVQRVPITEAGGRIHTSTISVVVLPEYKDTSDIEIKEEDLKIETFRSSGAGGQHVNKTESAVRITHIPTGIVVSVQDERSQHQNKAKALRILRAKLKEIKEREKFEEIGQKRKSMVGSMERSEKIRTYNWPQNRVTDHRLEGENKNYSLELIIEGELDELLDALSLKFSNI
ncbi:MAG: peptide chain release factor 1 [candidate division WOR-3 bacterium]|nr:peptide chain release factor 1 [candidate division WOR-3 bacterium]MCX7947831.1 peptide chain release factor 1 [candidate division WOR-3 bacterium]MDW8150788.1 peptide chain release factor 1 [candidate division WOR-3 bacterium]